MSFKLSIEVPGTKLAATLRRLNGHKVMVENIHDEPPVETKKNGNGKKMHSRAESILTMSGKTAKKGTQLAKAITLFEKLEVRQGIGSIKVADFRVELVKKKLGKHLAQRCVTEGFLSYVE